MSKRLRIKTDTAFDVINSNIPLPLITGTEASLGSLTLKLVSREQNVLVRGVVSLNMNQVTFGAANGQVSITINVYRDIDKNNLVYSADETLDQRAAAGAILQAANYQVPIQFVELPTLKSTEDTVQYYFTITVNQSGGITPADPVTLNKYSIIAEEITQ